MKLTDISFYTYRGMMALGGPVYFTDIIASVLQAEVRLLEQRLRVPLSTRWVLWVGWVGGRREAVSMGGRREG